MKTTYAPAQVEKTIEHIETSTTDSTGLGRTQRHAYQNAGIS